MWGKEFFVLKFIFAHTHKRGTSPKKRLVELHRHAPGQWLQCNRRQRVNAEGVTATTTTMTLDGKCQTRDELKLRAGSTLVVLELVASQSSRQDSQTAARRVVGAFHVLLWAFASCSLPLAFCLSPLVFYEPTATRIRGTPCVLLLTSLLASAVALMGQVVDCALSRPHSMGGTSAFTFSFTAWPSL